MLKTHLRKFRYPLSIIVMLIILLGVYQNCMETKKTTRVVNGFEERTEEEIIVEETNALVGEDWTLIYAQSSAGTTIYQEPTDILQCDYRLILKGGQMRYDSLSLPASTSNEVRLATDALEVYDFLFASANSAQLKVHFIFSTNVGLQPVYILNSMTAQPFDAFLEQDPHSIAIMYENCAGSSEGETNAGGGGNTL